MGCEYVIRVSRDQIPAIDSLDEILKRLPHYFGRIRYSQSEAIEFRLPETLKDLSGMPDVSVSCHNGDIVICQFGDSAIMAQILGTLAAEFVYDAPDEHVDIYMAGAEPPRLD